MGEEEEVLDTVEASVLSSQVQEEMGEEPVGDVDRDLKDRE